MFSLDFLVNLPNRNAHIHKVSSFHYRALSLSLLCIFSLPRFWKQTTRWLLLLKSHHVPCTMNSYSSCNISYTKWCMRWVPHIRIVCQSDATNFTVSLMDLITIDQSQRSTAQCSAAKSAVLFAFFDQNSPQIWLYKK